MVLFGGHVWFYLGVCGFIWGACVVLFGGHVWFYLGGHTWFYSGGACMVFSDTMRYGQWMGGMHPTGMHSCCLFSNWIVANVYGNENNWVFYRPQLSWGKVIFSQVSVILLTGGVCMVAGGLCMVARGVCMFFSGGAYVVFARWGACVFFAGGVHGFPLGGLVWFLLGGVACFFFAGGRAWFFPGGRAWFFPKYGQWVGGTHPTGMHSCWSYNYLKVNASSPSYLFQLCTLTLATQWRHRVLCATLIASSWRKAIPRMFSTWQTMHIFAVSFFISQISIIGRSLKLCVDFKCHSS